MKKSLCLLLALALLLSGCGKNQKPEGATLFLYYRCTDSASYSARSAISAEPCTFESASPDAQTVLQQYLMGPTDESLILPVQSDTSVENVDLSDGTLTVSLSGEYDVLSGMDLTIANACLTMTLEQIEGVQNVVLKSGSKILFNTKTMQDDSFVTTDNGATDKEQSIRIYFADSDNRYLMGDQRDLIVSENQSTPVYIVQQLIAGPTDDNLQPTMPEGTELLNLSVENGLCTVNLSQEFLDNKPDTELGERMTVWSLVDSLTELDTITQVLIEVEGEPLDIYRFMDLSKPLKRYTDAIGPVRAGMDEFDATIYMQGWSSEYLAQFPLRIQQTVDKTQAELVLDKLLSYDPPTGYENPIPTGTSVVSLSVSDGVCRLTLTDEFVRGAGTLQKQRMRVNAVVASLTALPSIDEVYLSVENRDDPFPGYDLSGPITSSEDWFFP